MAYLDKLIAAGEKVVYRTRRHRLVLLRAIGLPLAIAAVGLGLLVAFGVLAQEPAAASAAGATSGDWAVALWWSGWAALVLGLGLALPGYLRWHTEQYAVTDRRVLQSEGVLSKRVLDSDLHKVNDVLLTQSFWGRVLNYGTIEILTASEAGVNRLDWIPQPLRFKRAMMDAKALGGESGREGEPPAPAGVASQLAQLEELRRKGLVAEDEYKTKRAEILSRI